MILILFNIKICYLLYLSHRSYILNKESLAETDAGWCGSGPGELEGFREGGRVWEMAAIEKLIYCGGAWCWDKSE